MTLNENYVSIGKVALELEISDHTISRWYKWAENDNFTKPVDLILPKYYYKDKRRTKYFKKTDIHLLAKFKDAMQTTHKGCMAEFNSVYQWGKRGSKFLDRDQNEIRKKMI